MNEGEPLRGGGEIPLVSRSIRSALARQVRSILLEADEPPVPLKKFGMTRLGELRPIELRALESAQLLGIRDRALPTKRAEFLAAPFCHQSPQLLFMVREIQKGCRGSPLLALEQQRHEWREQREGRDGLESRHVEQAAEAFTLRAIADLVVILRAHDQLIRLDARRRPTVPAAPMHRMLTLIHIAHV